MVKLAIAVLLIFAGCAWSLHNPLVPDTLYASDAGQNYEGYMYMSKSSFAAARGNATGTGVSSNADSAAERAVYYKTDSSDDSTTLGRYFVCFDTINGTFASNFPASFRVDSTVWAITMEGDVDSAECGDTLYVVPQVVSVAPVAVGATKFNDIYGATATFGYDTTCYATLKKSNSRISVTMPARFTDSLETWLTVTGANRFSGLCMLTCADFKYDSAAANTGNYLESASLWHDDIAVFYNRPYLLVYWTETTATSSGGSGNVNAWQKWGIRWPS